MTLALSNQIIWPCDLSEASKADIMDIAVKVDGVDKYKTLLDDDYKRGLFYCVHGLGTFATTSLDNRPLASFIFGKGMWVGAVAIEIFPKINLYTCELEPLTSYFFSKKELNELAKSNGEIYKLLYSIMRNNTPKLVQGMHLSFYGIEERIMYFLLELARSKGIVDTSVIELKITQQQLSEIANVSRPRVNEILNKLAGLGYISLVRGKMIILNYEGLTKSLVDKVVM
ncbi:Crp/Fnr family transcriptional regulator [Shewanella donghaensis]|uniref:Crp/Fnr family transcriptional regulator n=1 Tax=Shewanella donghaensis TaxID=238836 RepID=UPI00118283EA|nr:Crp/Fnr family transcriptional regulator [Shewanella donghaensis]